MTPKYDDLKTIFPMQNHSDRPWGQENVVLDNFAAVSKQTMCGCIRNS